MTMDSLVEQGRQLRADVVAKYKELQAAGALNGEDARKGVDITPVVLRYFPAGISFLDAEAILRAAGSKLKDPPVPQRSGEIFASFLLPAAPLSLAGVKCAVSLVPKVARDYGTVGNVAGHLIFVYP
jgi:hypothetical protein